MIVALAALSGTTTTARASGWVEALSELRPAAADLNDTGLPLAERVELARALGAFGPDRDAVPVLLAALQAKPPAPPPLRDAILLALARRAPAAAAAPLAELLAREQHPSPALPLALSAIGTGAALQALIDALARPDAAAAAEDGLRRAGPHAAPALVRALHGAAGARAARLLGELGPDAGADAAAALLRALSQGGPGLRAEAARALGRLQARAAAPALLALLRDPAPELVNAALSALAELGSAAQGPALAAFLARAGTAQRPLALRALAAADPARAVPALQRALQRGAGDARAAALAALEGERVSPGFLPLLARLFASELREATASALARLPEGMGVPALLGAAARSPQAAQRAARALALALRSFEESLPDAQIEAARELLRALPAGERRLLLLALARDPQALPATRSALAAADPRWRASAAAAAALLANAELAPELIAALAREREPEAARALALACAELGAAAPLASLWRWIARDDTAPEAMLLAAQHADRSAPDPKLQVHLRRVLASRRPARLRSAAALALGALGEASARTPLWAALADPATRVRLAAARALGALGGAEPARLCRSHARIERDPLVRRTALAVALAGGRTLPLLQRGPLVLEVRVGQAEPGERPLLDVLLADGRWLRLRAHPGGELILGGLPPGSAELRRVD